MNARGVSPLPMGEVKSPVRLDSAKLARGNKSRLFPAVNIPARHHAAGHLPHVFAGIGELAS
jgi:hypothetical protein